MTNHTRIINGAPIRPFPYTVRDLKAAFPSVSFRKTFSEPVKQEYSIVGVQDTPKPAVTKAQVAIPNELPHLEGGAWVLGWTVRDKTPEEITADLAAERASMVCSRAQGKMAIGPTVWEQTVGLADDPETPWGLRVAVYDTYEWRRLDPNMDALIWAMGLSPTEADDLFRLAMTL